MGLINCPDCGKEVSERAPECPNCGAPIARAVSTSPPPPDSDPHREAGSYAPASRSPDYQDRRPRRPHDGRDWDEPDVRLRVTRQTIRKFREQIHALGAVWIFLGSVAALVAGFAVLGSTSVAKLLGADVMLLLVIIGAMGGLWLTVGILTCLKQMWAVYVGLGLSYLSLVGQILNFNVCSTIILIAVILQAHRVIGWANQMNAAGIPLTAKPD